MFYKILNLEEEKTRLEKRLQPPSIPNVLKPPTPFLTSELFSISYGIPLSSLFYDCPVIRSADLADLVDLVLEIRPDILGQTHAVVEEGLKTLPGCWKTF